MTEGLPYTEVSGELLAFVVRDWIANLDESSRSTISVVPVPPTAVTSTGFAQLMGIPLALATSTLVVECERAGRRWTVVVVTPGDARADLNGKLRRLVGARSVRLADEPTVAHVFQQEKGSIGPLGVPKDVTIIIDQSLTLATVIFAGSGSLSSKVGFPPALLLGRENVVVADITKAKIG